jgi:hypothetical protein
MSGDTPMAGGVECSLEVVGRELDDGAALEREH